MLGLLSGPAARALRLPPALTTDVRLRRGIGLRSRDGAILRTDHYAPGLDDAPTVLVRTPYGRGAPFSLAARVLAEQGFHVVVSSCRGTGGSSGRFDPMRHERDDGLDTVEWLRRQPWFNGRLGTFGPSYVGYTQWAIADVPELAAMATVITSSQFRDPTYSGDAYALFTTLAWASLLHTQQRPWLENLRTRPERRLYEAFSHLPLGEADRIAVGAEVDFFRRWLGLANGSPEERDAYWADVSHDHRVAGVSAPVLMIGGWHDIFLPWQLRDYAALRAAGARPHLTIGPWTHGSPGLAIESLRESVDWLRVHLRGEGTVRERPVRLCVENGLDSVRSAVSRRGGRILSGGLGSVRSAVSRRGGRILSDAAEWREYDEWPPAGTTETRCYLGPHGRLSGKKTPQSTPDTFVYDPTDPTPSVGGPVLLANVAGPRDNRALEARADVLVYSSEVLQRAVEVIGPVHATVHVRADRPYFDVFVRLCDVDTDGRSINVTDGLARVIPGRYKQSADGTTAVEVELWPAGHRFPVGHRLRLQISGGAHPRYARNPGSDTPLATAVDLRPVAIEVYHDRDRPSAVRLRVA